MLIPVVVKDLIVFFLRVRVRGELKGRVLALEGRVSSNNHEADGEFQMVDETCVLEKEAMVMQELLVCMSLLATLNNPH